jgi:hypothetical protein
MEKKLRHYNKWSINEVIQLQREYELLQLSIQEIAKRHERSVRAILCKLEKEKFILHWYEAKGFDEYVIFQPDLFEYYLYLHNNNNNNNNTNNNFKIDHYILDDERNSDNSSITSSSSNDSSNSSNSFQSAIDNDKKELNDTNLFNIKNIFNAIRNLVSYFTNYSN